MSAGTSLARRRLHPRLPPGAPPSWRQDLGLQDGVYIPNHPPTASKMLALPAAIRQQTQLPGAPPSWWQELRLQDGVYFPTTPGSAAILAAGTSLARRRLYPRPPPNGQQDAGAPGGDQAAPTTPRSAAILAAGTSLARRRLHPHHPPRPAGCWRSRGRAPLPGAPPSWRQELHLQDGGSIPTTPQGQQDAGAPGGAHHSRERRHLGGRNFACRTAAPSPPLPGAPPSWRQELRLQDGGSIPTTPGSAAILAAGCPRSLSNHVLCAGAQ